MARVCVRLVKTELNLCKVSRGRPFCSQQLILHQPDIKNVFSSIINASTKSVHLSLSSHLNKLSQELLEDHPAATLLAWEEPLLVVRLRELELCGHEKLEGQARLCLALLGQPPSYSGSGLRILSIDGGGTRGVMPLTVLQHLEERCGQPVHQLFDLVCGTSTGSILASLLCLEKMSTRDCKEVYLSLSREIFKMNNLLGMSQLFFNHAFYDSKLLQRHLRQYQSVNLPMWKTSSIQGAPRLCFVATVTSQPVVAPYLFCNYRHRPLAKEVREEGLGSGGSSGRSHYQQRCDTQCWEAIMASTAAPGFFEEVRLAQDMFMDGGILTNNPCGVAIHEARLLWGSGVPIQTVISLGTGLKYKKTSSKNLSSTKSFREKIIKVVEGATDTETVHTILRDVYDSSTYFRFQPNLSEDIDLDESRPEKLDLLCRDTERFIVEHEDKLRSAASSLMRGKRTHQKVQDWVSLSWGKLASFVQHNRRKLREKKS